MKNTIKQKFFVCTLFTLGLITSVLPVQAAGNSVLSGVEVSQNEAGKFQITLNADKQAAFTKHIINENNIVIDLKDVTEAESVNTVYKNTASIDHVIVQPVGSKDLRILIQGENVSFSNVSFANAIEGLNLDALKETPSNEIELNRPVSSYTPVQAQEEEELDSNSMSDVLGGLSFNNLAKKSNIGWLIAAITLIITGFATLKLLNSEENDNIKIDLSQAANREREIDLFQQLGSREGLIAKSISNTKQAPSLTQRQGVVNAAGYGLKEYKNSQVDPNYRYSRQTKAPAAKKPQPAYNTASARIQSNSNAALKQAPMPRVAQKMPIQAVSSAKNNIDSMKFLEAMTQIYEKSGRVDLAHGVRNNLMKAKAVSQRI